MGHLAEPKGVDFIIESKPMTAKEKAELAEFIKKRKSVIEKQEQLRRKRKKTEKAT